MPEPDSWSVTLSKEDVELCWRAARETVGHRENQSTVSDLFRRNLFGLARLRRALAAGDVIFPSDIDEALHQWVQDNPSPPEILGPYGLPRGDGSIEVKQDRPRR